MKRKHLFKLTLMATLLGTALTACNHDESDDDNNDPQNKSTDTTINLKAGSFAINETMDGVDFTGGNSLDLSVGVGSGAFHYPGDPSNEFYAVTDRGPNVACDDSETIIGIKDFCKKNNGEVDESGKIFPVKDFTPTIYKFRITENDGTLGYEVLEKITLKDDNGDAISGVVNPLISTDTENGYASDKNQLSFDAEGVDTEALVRLKDGSFWLADEYGPSLIHVAADGKIIERVVPEDVAMDLSDADYKVTGSLPNIYKKRKLNRGIESVAVTPDEKYLYFIMQSPLANPDGAAYKQSRNVRLMKMALNDDVSIKENIGEYVYVMDRPMTFADKTLNTGDLKAGKYRAQKDVKISEMVAVGEDDLIVLERISKVTKLYRINLAHADNILGSYYDNINAEKSLEKHFDLNSQNATPVIKQLVFNSMTDTPDGIDMPKKVEGIAMLDDEHVLLINDNDFGINGNESKAVILNIAKQLTDGPAPTSISLGNSYSYDSGLGEGAAEIVTYDADNKQLFVVNAETVSVDVLDISNPASPSKLNTIDVASLGKSANSVAVKDGKLAIAIEVVNSTDGSQQETGKVAVFDTKSLDQLNVFDVGFLPDMVSFTPDGKKILVANEGEPNDKYSEDPEGSVSIIDIAAEAVTHIDFTDFNNAESRSAELSEHVRVFGPDATVAQDLEPEYITISEDGKTAWVSLQENNAIAIIDIDSASVTAIQALGVKDYSVSGNGIDASDKDDMANVKTRDNVVGMYQPDAIASYSYQENTYIVSANEGDARDYWFDAANETDCIAQGGVDWDDEDGCLAYSEEARLGKIDSAMLIPELQAVTDNADLGRIKMTLENGKDENGVFNTVYSYGARSFSIWNAEAKLVFDSGDDISRLLAERLSAEDYVDGVDGRSDDKGAEPEGVVVGEVNGRTYAFVGLERANGFMIYDITNPYGVQFVDYVRGPLTDIGPEGMTFISKADSPDDKPYLVISNEVSGTTTLYEINVK